MRFFLICIFLSGIFLKTLSNELDKSQLADSLYLSGNYFEAAIEYEREFFYSQNNEEKNNALYLKAMCYKALGNYEVSFNTLQRISLFGVPQDKRNLFNYETALMAFLCEEYSQCEKMLIVLSRSEQDSSFNANIQLLGTLNYIMLADYTSSLSYAKGYLKAINDTSEMRMSAMEQIYSKKNLPKLKNEKVLYWIGIIPGFGQMYVGKVGEGITNMTMNLALFSFGVYQVFNGFYFTGYFVSTLSINKLYFGGRTRASNLLQTTNQNRLIEFQEEVKSELLQ